MKINFSQIKKFLLLATLFTFSIYGKKKPNFVMVVTDSHPISAFGAYEGYLSKQNPTPNLDRIALKSTFFLNSFCANASSMPSLMTLFTGKHYHASNLKKKQSLLKNFEDSLPHNLQKVGYDTIYIGKWIFEGYPKYFNYWKILNDPAEKYNPEFLGHEDKMRIEGYSTDIITDFAIQWLSKANNKKPFFLFIHYNATSMPWIPAIRHLNLYDDILLPEPVNLEDQHLSKASPSRYQSMDILEDLNITRDLFFKVVQKDENKSEEIIHSDSLKNLESMTAEQRTAWTLSWRPKNEALLRESQNSENTLKLKFQRFVKNYLRCIYSVDENLERIESALKQLHLDNVSFIYTSNQGRMLGEHGWFGSGWMYEESMRIPLLMSTNLATNSTNRIAKLVQNLDLTPTILDYAEVKNLDKFQGKSLKPLIESIDSNITWRESIYYHFNEFPGSEMVAKHNGIRTSDYKLIHFYQFNEWEFFDLKKDPFEENNLYGNESYRISINGIKRTLGATRKFYQDKTDISIMPNEWRKKYRGPESRKE